MRAGFVSREAGAGLRRNLTLTFAVVLTIAVSLTLLGVSLMLRAQVNAMQDYWYDKVEVSVFLCSRGSDAPTCAGGEVTDDQRELIEGALLSLDPLVEEVFYESKEDAFSRFSEQFSDSPILGSLTPDSLPESFRVKLSDPTQFYLIASSFSDVPGVEEVSDQRTILEGFFRILLGLQLIALVVAVSMLFVTVLLTVNTMRLAVFSRRREAEVMRLVGASKLYIQLPFVLEAVFSAVAGAALAVVTLASFQYFVIENTLVPAYPFTAFIGWDAVWEIVPVLVAVGVLISTLAASLTLRKYLRV